MKFDHILQELRSEPVTEGALEKTISTVLNPPRKPRTWVLRRGLPFAVGIGLVVCYAVIPWRKDDQLWAQAKASYFDAKIIHIRIEKAPRTGPGEAWIHGEKSLETSKFGEIRFNGKFMTQISGRVASFSPVNRASFVFLPSVQGFIQSLARIKEGKATRGKRNLQGKSYTTYRFNFGGIGFTDAKGNESGLIANMYLTAFVDESLGKIVRIEQKAEALPSFAKYNKTHSTTLSKTWLDDAAMEAEIDYPDTIDDKIFDPPADAIDGKASHDVVASVLAGNVGQATVSGQKVTLKGILFDGKYANVIWSGCPADFNAKDRFRIEGVKLGSSWDVRCLSAGKSTKPSTAKNPFCQQASEVLSTLPKTVTITLPVFGPDKSRPYPGGKGFHSKKVGETTFRDVPVTPTLWLQTYERQFGLYKSWW